MRINHNIMAMNAHRQLSINSSSQGKSIEKLSSGLRINRAGDDAAGLAISEKMRSQVRGLSKASRNAQDDISLIQTTEGALNESHAIIHRMREMAVQSANDSNTDDDRGALQAEMDQLSEELTRIANTTEFNTRKLLNGNLNEGTTNATGDLTFHIGANKDQNMKFGVQAMDAFSLNLTEDRYQAAASGAQLTSAKVTRPEQGKGITVLSNETTDANRKINVTSAEVANTGKAAKIAATQVGQTETGGAVSLEFKFAATSTGEKYNGIKVKFVQGSAADPAVQGTWDALNKTVTLELGTTAANNTANAIQTALAATVADGYTFTGATVSGTDGLDATKLSGKELVFSKGEDKLYTVTATAAQAVGGITYKDSAVVKESAKEVTFGKAFKGLELKSANVTEGTQGDVDLDIEKSAKATFNVDHSVDKEAKVAYGINILTQASSNNAIERIDSALKKVSDVRAGLGAVQNRLEHTIKNVDTAAENLQASESRIRDVDMAKEMMTYTKNNILQQAAQAMLAQANQTPQGVLQLLR